MRKILRMAAVGFVAVITMGSTGTQSAEFVATAATLSPEKQAVVASPEPIVVTKVVHVAQPATPAPTTAPAAPTGSTAGYAGMGGQCTDYIRMVAPHLWQSGNAGSWTPNSSVPKVGAVMIWAPGEQGASGVGHVAMVVGINGSRIIVAHWNWPGQTEFYSTGKFKI